MHLTMLSVSIIIYYTDPNKDVFNTNFCASPTSPTPNIYYKTPSSAFYWLVANNAVNILLGATKHILTERTAAQRTKAKNRFDARHNYGYLNMFLHLAMVFMNFFSVIIAQCALFNFYNKTGDCHHDNIDEHTLTLNWLFIQVIIFYLNFFSMLVFLVLSRCFKFRTLREKAGLGGNLRNTVDFLDFCQHDVHWISFQVT